MRAPYENPFLFPPRALSVMADNMAPDTSSFSSSGRSDPSAAMLPGMQPCIERDGLDEIGQHWEEHLERQVVESRSVRAWEEEEEEAVGDEDWDFFDGVVGVEERMLEDDDGDVNMVGD